MLQPLLGYCSDMAFGIEMSILLGVLKTNGLLVLSLSYIVNIRMA